MKRHVFLPFNKNKQTKKKTPNNNKTTPQILDAVLLSFIVSDVKKTKILF